jgi:hypothetical protein
MAVPWNLGAAETLGCVASTSAIYHLADEVLVVFSEPASETKYSRNRRWTKI